jgi:hypothetical protein
MVPSLPLEIVQDIIAAAATHNAVEYFLTLLPSLALVHRTPFARLLMRMVGCSSNPKPELLQTLAHRSSSTRLNSLHISISAVDLAFLLAHTPNLVQLEATIRNDESSARYHTDDSGIRTRSPTADIAAVAPFLGKELPRLRALTLDALLVGLVSPGRDLLALLTSLGSLSTLQHLQLLGSTGGDDQALPPPPATFKLRSRSLFLYQCWTRMIGHDFKLSYPTLTHLTLSRVDRAPQTSSFPSSQISPRSSSSKLSAQSNTSSPATLSHL